MSTGRPPHIAIIGLYGRFPGADGVEAFWANLRGGVEGLTHFTEDELATAGVAAAQLQDPHYVRAAGVLADADRFDAAFFGYAPREAAAMDPQHRVFLEGAWAALEHAGYCPDHYDGAVGVYAGSSLNTYLPNNLFAGRPFAPAMNDLSVLIGNGPEYLATRVSYQLNLRGPSLAVQAACATSLAAVAQAGQALLTYQCDLALAGGVSVRVPQQRGYTYVADGIFSPDGHCRAFDARAQGTVFGNGVGIVVLKRLDEARADGDTIYAVLRGAAINNDGSDKVGYTAPGVNGQAQVIALAQALAGVAPSTISYVEAHGTGTPLGDPIEVAALTQAFGPVGRGRCALGSVKTNIGHLDAAAGVAGLIKTVLALHHRQLPPSLHYEQPNPNIDFSATPFYVNHTLQPWPAGPTPRRAGVSAFGIGGTNVHVVLEEAPLVPERGPAGVPQLLVLSARTPTALEAMTDRLARHLEATPGLHLADAAFTLQAGRTAMPYRRALVATTPRQAAHALVHRDAATVADGIRAATADAPGVALVFPGQGAQYVNMGRGLYAALPTFRRHLDHCAERLQPSLGCDLRSILFPAEGAEATAGARLRQTALAQPALFAVSYAMAQCYLAWGVRPRALLGHSVGEVVAACVAGVFTLDDALAFVALRGRLMQAQPPGAMLAVARPAADVAARLDEPLALAVVNSPTQCVVAGPDDAVAGLAEQLAAEGIACRRLSTSHAFHSSMMAPVLPALRDHLRSVALQPPQIPFLSNVTGTWITPAEATDPAYWARHVRQTVRFAEAVAVLQQEQAVLLEAGPRQLPGLLAGQPPAAAGSALPSMRHREDDQPDLPVVLRALQHLWLRGVDLRWDALHQDTLPTTPPRRIPLPTYPFEGRRYWVDPASLDPPSMDPAPAVPSLLRTADPAAWYYVPSWQRVPRVDAGTTPAGQTWLVCGEAHGLGDRLRARLFAQGHRVVWVQAGASFADQGQGVYTLAPHVPAHYHRLFNALHAANRLPDRIIYVCRRPSEGAPLGDPLPGSTRYTPFFDLLYLAQALASVASRQPVRLGVVSTALFDVLGDEPVQAPEQALALGPVRVLPQEFANVSCCHIDLGPVPHEDLGTAAAQVIAEAAGAPAVAHHDAQAHHEVVAYRGTHRWVQTYVPVRLPERPAHAQPLRRRGVYLITGGLGGVGMALAAALIQAVSARLVLTSRTGLPDRTHWTPWLATHDYDDRTSRRIRQVQALETQGADVLVVRADAADAGQMQQAFDQAVARFGAVHGVIHAAGLWGTHTMATLTAEQANPVLDAKVRALHVLTPLARTHGADFVVLCASIATALGGVGQADYTAANAFMDAYARRHHRRDGPAVISIGWEAWRDVGMAAEAGPAPARQGRRAAILQQALHPDEGVEAFFRILAAGLPQVAVSTTHLPARRRAHQRDDPPNQAAPQAAHLDAAAAADDGLGFSDTERAVAGLWKQLLGLEHVGRHDDFFACGGDSLLATQLNNRLRQRFTDAELSLSALFDHPTVAGLAALIAGTPAADAEAAPIPLREQLAAHDGAARRPVLEAFLQRHTADALGVAANALPDAPLEDATVAGHLIRTLRTALDLPLYQREVQAQRTLPCLATFILHERDALATLRARPTTAAPVTAALPPRLQPSAPPFTAAPSGLKHPMMGFVLSTPRAGSTLLRLMLSAHPALFCPPELTLLGHQNLRSWSNDPVILMPHEGLVEAFAALPGGDRMAAAAEVERLVAAACPTADVFRMLQERLGSRLLVDKTPANALRPEVLHRAEALFDRPRYLHLVRHPYAVIDSFIRARFHRALGDAGDPFAIAEAYWRIMNENILALGRTVGGARLHRIYYEELVQEPERVLRGVCAFLGLPFEAAMLEPYTKSEMPAGPGDPNIFKHNKIEPGLGTIWQRIELPQPLGTESQRLADLLGYPLPQQALRPA